MASIEKRINGSKITYRARIRLKGLPIQQATFSTKTKAQEWANKTEILMKEGKYLSQVRSKEHTVAEMIDRYIDTVLSKKPKLQKDYARYLLTFKDLIGNYTLHQATPSVIVEARDTIANIKTRKGTLRSGATVNRYLASLSSAFSTAVNEWEWLEVNPMLRVKKATEARGRVRYLDDKEREDLLEACLKASNPYLYPAVIIAISTGARKMEILSLKWKDINILEGRAILHDTKNGERRSLSLMHKAKDAMQELYNNRSDDNWVFPSKDNTKPFDITRSWRKALNDASIVDFRFHDLRHTAASYLAMNGATMGEIADILGHKTLQMVKRYSHLSDEHKQSVVESMNNKIFGGE
jgi:integrase